MQQFGSGGQVKSLHLEPRFGAPKVSSSLNFRNQSQSSKQKKNVAEEKWFQTGGVGDMSKLSS